MDEREKQQPADCEEGGTFSNQSSEELIRSEDELSRRADFSEPPCDARESIVITGRKQGTIIRFDGPEGHHSIHSIDAGKSSEPEPQTAAPPSPKASVKPRLIEESDADEDSRSVREVSGETFLTRITWWSATLALLVGGWLIGPAMVERFSYAHTRGQMMARYEIAKTALESDPALTLSMTGQWVAQKVRPSVAHIRTIGLEEFGDANHRRAMLSEGQGSAVVVGTDGFLLTNEHVVMDATEIWVILSDRREYQARLVGSDPETDLAVLQIEETGLVPIEWAAEDSTAVGSLVWAVGSPFGLEQSTTQGIISALHRRKGDDPSQSRHQDLLQSDCAINPGNSGGPLVNSKGELVGVNTSIVGDAFCGISFSVPSVVAKEVYERLLAEGEVQRGFLGVEPTVIPGHLVKLYGIADGKGAYVQHVVEGGAAERAGIREGDIILTWNGQVVDNDIILFRLVGLTPVETKVSVGLLRNGQPMEVVVQVASRSLE